MAAPLVLLVLLVERLPGQLLVCTQVTPTTTKVAQAVGLLVLLVRHLLGQQVATVQLAQLVTQSAEQATSNTK